MINSSIIFLIFSLYDLILELDSASTSLSPLPQETF
jgi:hypothetical protein